RWPPLSSLGVISNILPIPTLVSPDKICSPPPHKNLDYSRPTFPDCNFTWSTWSDCDQECAGGHKSRKVNIVITAALGYGHPCPPADKVFYALCNEHDCPMPLPPRATPLP